MTNIHVLIPSYNCGEWIERCLDSLEQTHAPTQVLVIDDASTQEGYKELAQQLCDERGYLFHRNAANRKCPYNLRLGIDILNPDEEDVIFLLDGDDFLPHDGVLARIAEVYADPDVWLTYGNYRPHPYNTGQVLAHAYPQNVIQSRSFRTHSACFNHPLTFRKFLWDQITDADLQTKVGKWFTGGYDMVIMAPMLEMSAPDHFRFLDEHLYTYNAINPLSDAIINVNLVEESREMMQRPKKSKLTRC